MAGAAHIRVKGRAEVEAAFMQVRRETLVGLKASIVESGKRVAESAHQQAPQGITNIGDRWSQFRIGATVRGVYVAPKYHRRGGSPRPNLGGALFVIMQRALDAKQEETVLAIGAMIDASIAESGLSGI